MKSPGRVSVLLAAFLLSGCEGADDPFDLDAIEGRSCVDADAEIPEAECIGLVFFFTNTDGPNWTNNTGWGENNRPCSWFGVTCADGRVSIVSLSSNGLGGSIPREFLALQNLDTLNLRNNQLTGTIPPEFTGLQNLRILHLRSNQLTGTIPATLGSVPTLRILNLGENQLTGTIPPQIGNLSNLGRLFLGGNQLTGTIPLEIGNLSNLEFLSLRQNQLEGLVPIAVADLGGQLQSAGLDQCGFDSNPGLFMPDSQDYMDADLDGDGFICGIALSPPP